MLSLLVCVSSWISPLTSAARLSLGFFRLLSLHWSFLVDFPVGFCCRMLFWLFPLLSLFWLGFLVGFPVKICRPLLLCFLVEFPGIVCCPVLLKLLSFGFSHVVPLLWFAFSRGLSREILLPDLVWHLGACQTFHIHFLTFCSFGFSACHGLPFGRFGILRAGVWVRSVLD